MNDDLYERYAQAAVDAAARVAFDKGLEVGYSKGFTDGLTTGQNIGFVAGVNSVADALSDGTRKGSSACAKALESLKRLGAIDDDE
jgi:hypothetical protein